MEVRDVLADEHVEAGELVVRAYRALPGAHLSEGYAAELADVARRAREADVLVVRTAARGGLVGCVTFVPGAASPWAELLEEGEAGIRMLAVDPVAQGHGIGRVLVLACIERARHLGCRGLMLHTTPWMTTAHRLYEREGFARFPARDWTPEPQVPLLSYRLVLDAASTAGEDAVDTGAPDGDPSARGAG
ncbi:MAG: GNAT family N-acetyltransferase [Acidimicrobiales bacterium]